MTPTSVHSICWLALGPRAPPDAEWARGEVEAVNHHQPQAIQQRDDGQQQRIGVGREAADREMGAGEQREVGDRCTAPGPSCRPCSWLASTISSATVVMSAANPSRNSSALRRLGSGGTTVTGACGCVLMTPPGSRCPASAVGAAAPSRSATAWVSAVGTACGFRRRRRGGGHRRGCLGRRRIRGGRGGGVGVEAGRRRGGLRRARRGGRRGRGGGGSARHADRQQRGLAELLELADGVVERARGQPAVTWARSDSRRSATLQRLDSRRGRRRRR